MGLPELIIKNNADFKKNILVVGVFHGDEPQGEYFINEYLKRSEKSGKNRMFFIPRLNSQNTRTNKNGVDLNRNFPTKNWELGERSEYFGGETPESEQETRFLTGLINSENFDAIVTIHAPYKIVNYDGEHSKALAQKASEFLGYPTEGDIGYPTPGSFGTYCAIERKIPTITVEIDEEEDQKKLCAKFCNFFEYLENTL